MISEAAQEQAALHALEMLDADEAEAFERAMAADAELRALTMDLRETAAALVLARARLAGEDAELPPTGLKARVLARVAAEAEMRGQPDAGHKVVAGPWTRWVPWALAATLALCCGALAFHQSRMRAEIAELRRSANEEVAANYPGPAQEAFRQVAFCALEPVPAAQQSGPQAAVLWNAARRRGQLRVSRLPPPGEGKDYQLWAVEAGRKDTVSAGVVAVDPKGNAEVDFRPEPGDGGAEVVAFALSVERAGGAPNNAGPVVFLGKLLPP